MTEEVLQYCWSNRLFDDLTVRGREAEVVDTGTLNPSDGPDFTMAKLRLGDLLWVGSVELHLHASDWYAHGHQDDPRYEELILHVVLDDDREVRDRSGRIVPCGVLRLSKEAADRVTALRLRNRSLRCVPEINEIGIEAIRSCFRPLIRERMQNRVRRLSGGLPADGVSVNSFLFCSVMRCLGCHRNNEVMEQTARTIPYRLLKRHASDTSALEAILMGQAALLEEEHPRDDYESCLVKEYRFYRSAYDLKPIAAGSFRKLRLRPAAYPARMLAVAAQIFHREGDLLRAITSRQWDDVKAILRVEPTEYWQTHIDFGRPHARRLGPIGSGLLQILLINAIIPTACYYAEQTGSHSAKEAAIDLLRHLPPERNSTIDHFRRNGIEPANALDTQCMLELYTNRCIPYHCLSCPMAIELFRRIQGLR